MKLQHHVDSPPRGRESHRLYRMYLVLEIASRKIFLNKYNCVCLSPQVALVLSSTEQR